MFDISLADIRDMEAVFVEIVTGKLYYQLPKK